MSDVHQTDSPTQNNEAEDAECVVPNDIQEVLCPDSIEMVKAREKQQRRRCSSSDSCSTTSHCSANDWTSAVPEDIREVFAPASEQVEASLFSKQQQQPPSLQPTLDNNNNNNIGSAHSPTGTTNVKQRTKRYLYQPSQDSAIVQYGKHDKIQQQENESKESCNKLELGVLQECDSRCLTVATKVVEDDLDSLGALKVVKAEPLFALSNRCCCRLPKMLQHKYSKYVVFVTIILALVAAGVVAWYHYMQCPECEFERFVDNLEEVFGPDLLKERSSTQALEWMSQQSPLTIQRFVVASIYFSTSADYGWNYCAPAQENDGDHCHAMYLGLRTHRGKRWLSNHRHECTWMGIRCTRNKEIFEVNLHSINASGTFPKTVQYLSHLKTLRMGPGTVHGPLPFADETLNNNTDLALPPLPSSLEILSIVGNRFTGSLPPSWYRLPNLRTLNVTGNRLAGSLSSEIGNLSNLEVLDLKGNRLSGTVPEELYDLSRLHKLKLESNRFEGTISSSIQKLSNLLLLYVGFNRFTGTVPSEIGRLSKLFDLQLSGLSTTGTLPDSIYEVPFLYSLRIAGSGLQGTISDRIGQLKMLGLLLLQDNAFTGTLPTTLEQLPRLRKVLVSGNQFEGSVPLCGVEQLWAECHLDCPCCTVCCTDGRSCRDP